MGMNPYSLDLRQRIVDAYQAGEGSIRELAERFIVSARTVHRYIQLERASGSVQPQAHRHGPLRRLQGHRLDLLHDILQQKNDRTDEEVATELRQRTGIKVSRRTVCRTWQRIGVTRKKKTSTRMSAIVRKTSD